MNNDRHGTGGRDDLDELDDAVIAADDTGMLAGERLITIAETEEPVREQAREADAADAGEQGNPTE